MILTASIRVPATSANLGPGFDALGLALKVYNTTTVVRTENGTNDPMAVAAGEAFFAESGVEPFGFDWAIEGDVPRARGLGSSVTVRLGILHGLNCLAGEPLDRISIYHLCASLEGHPDNAAPAAFGGFTIARHDHSWQRFPVSDCLTFVLLVPAFEVETSAARKVLPDVVPFADAVLSASNSAAIAAAFASQNYAALTGCFADGLHQPYRSPLVPGFQNVVDAAVEAGAIGGWLSGSGSTIAACITGDPTLVVDAMVAAYDGRPHKLIITHADNEGVRVLQDENLIA